MIKNITILFFLLSIVKLNAQSQTRKVLFLGNSYTYVNDLPNIVSLLASNTNDVLIYDSNLIGGYTLQDHSASTVSKNKILSDNWDYIVLQEQSQRPSFSVPLAFFYGFSDLRAYINLHKPCAQITAFMTWGHENGDVQNCPSNPAVCSYLGMQNLIQDRYMSFSELNNSEVTPVGVVWKYIKENYPGINLYQSDASHPSLEGSYLAACCFYTSIFRKNPDLITYNHGLSASTASIIRSAVKTIVYDHMIDWYIGKYVPSADFNYIIGNGLNEIVIKYNRSKFYDSCVWDFGDGTSSTQIMPSHSYSNIGNYTIKLTANKCYLGQNLTSVFERTVNFCAHTNTIFPDDILICPDQTGTLWTQPADTYQWCDEYGNPIEGETNQSLTSSPGLYSVITSVNNCFERSAPVFIDTYAVIGDELCSLNTDNPVFKDEFILSPNPVHTLLNVKSPYPIKTLMVYDMLGNNISSVPVLSNGVDVSFLAQGMYIIKIVGENGKSYSAKFIKY